MLESNFFYSLVAGISLIALIFLISVLAKWFHDLHRYITTNRQPELIETVTLHLYKNTTIGDYTAQCGKIIDPANDQQVATTSTALFFNQTDCQTTAKYQRCEACLQTFTTYQQQIFKHGHRT